MNTPGFLKRHALKWYTRATVALLTFWICGGGVPEAEARFKRPVQVPNGLKYSCRTCHVDRGTTRTLLNIPVDEETREALDEGDRICSSCHSDPSGGGARNVFGQAVEKGYLTESGWNGNVIWGTTLANLDSDGDGFTNGQELGDPEGRWRPGDPPPGKPTQITNPGAPASRPGTQTLSPSGDKVFALQADFDGDGEVGLSDFFQFGGGVGKKKREPGFDARLDLNGDDVVDVGDFFLFAQDFGKSTQRVQTR